MAVNINYVIKIRRNKVPMFSVEVGVIDSWNDETDNGYGGQHEHVEYIEPV